MRILGIETSCDETAVAVYDSHHGLMAHQIYSQISTHQVYGGVVPELASRDHIRKTIPLIQQSLDEAGLSPKDINGIAYTRGPGLIGALMVGAAVAKSLGYAWGVPTLGIHHMESHLLAVMLEEPQPQFPFVALLVSGGHTMLVLVHGVGHYALLGESLDDAVGEAFDKVAKMLGLPYPGGPALSALAEAGSDQFHFPRPMIHRQDLNFSFSGLKTHVMKVIRTENKTTHLYPNIARAFEDAVVEVLMVKCKRALEKTGLNKLVVVGGVSANKTLRRCMHEMISKLHGNLFFPRPEFCTDNGAMVAYNGWLRLSHGEREGLSIQVKPRWQMTSLNKLGES